MSSFRFKFSLRKFIGRSRRLGSTFLKTRSPVSTRVELASLGLLGVLWLALGVFLGISAAAEADVECFAADSSESDPIEFPGCMWHFFPSFSAFADDNSSHDGNVPCPIPGARSFLLI